MESGESGLILLGLIGLIGLIRPTYTIRAAIEIV